jgi:hypothetical protein
MLKHFSSSAVRKISWSHHQRIRIDVYCDGREALSTGLLLFKFNLKRAQKRFSTIKADFIITLRFLYPKKVELKYSAAPKKKVAEYTFLRR